VIVHADRSTSELVVDEAADALDALLPGLSAAVIDLVDAIHDRADDLGLSRPELLTRVAEQLTRVWVRTPGAERPLVVLDAVRCVVNSRP
jgi:hypothetical protein